MFLSANFSESKFSETYRKKSRRHTTDCLTDFRLPSRNLILTVVCLAKNPDTTSQSENYMAKIVRLSLNCKRHPKWLAASISSRVNRSAWDIRTNFRTKFRMGYSTPS